MFDTAFLDHDSKVQVYPDEVVFFSAIEQFIETLDALVLVKDSNLNLIFSNQEAKRRLKLPSAQIVKKDFDDLYPELAASSEEQELELIANNTDVTSSFESILTLNGENIFVKARKSVLKTPIRNSKILMCTYIDKSNYHSLENEKRELEKSSNFFCEASQAKDRFLATVSHEIRTPLNIILGCIDLMQDMTKGKLLDSIPVYLDKMSSSANHLNNLIEDVLNISLIENNQLKATPAEFKIADFCKKIVQELSIVGVKSNKKVHIKLDSSIQDSCFTTDTKFLRQIISNLVSNSFKYSGVEKCSVEVATQENSLLIKISDKGKGMSPDHLSRVFEPFYQIQKDETLSKSGVGLGLSLVYKLVQEVGGSIKIDSALNVGTAVHVRLPRLEPLFQSDVSIIGTIDFKKVLDGKRLLVVEDDPDNRFVFAKYFASSGAHVEFAEDGYEGWSKFKEFNGALDLMLIDLRMPKLNGYELISKVRKWEKTNNKSSMPAICLSANVSKSDQEKAIDSGFNSFIKKPVSKKDLLECSAHVILKK